MIKAIIFDCFGVLYTDGKSQIINACAPEKRQQLYDLFGQADYGFISGEEFSVSAAELLGTTRDKLDGMANGLYARNEALVELIRRYKQHYKTGLLSNVSEDLYLQLFTEKDEQELFDAVVLSSRVGVIKPSPSSYQLIAEMLDEDPQDCVMIDDIERNVRGAEDVGMRGVLYTSNSQLTSALSGILEQEYA